MIVIQIVGLANGQTSMAEGLFVEAYTPSGNKGLADLDPDLPVAVDLDGPLVPVADVVAYDVPAVAVVYDRGEPLT